MTIPGLHLTSIGKDDVLLEPLNSLNIGDKDKLLAEVSRYLLKMGTRRLYYDLSSMALIEPLYYAWLDALARVIQTLNIQMICVNMQPTAAFALSQFLRNKPVFQTALSIQSWRDTEKL